MHAFDDEFALMRGGRLSAAVLLLSAIACAPASETDSPGNSRATGDGPPAGYEYSNQDPSVAYVGAETCRECHEGIYLTYSQTGMGRAFYPLTPDNIVEDFTDNNELIEASGLRYRMFERDGKYYQRQFVLDSAGRELAAEERELVLVIGSNNHNRSYVTLYDNKMFQAPICWYPQGSRWELCPGYEFKNDHFGREISQSCVNCHNGMMQLVEGERNQFEEPYPHGIGCERCHGPGQLHVARWAKETPTGRADPTIVNPRRLEPSRRSQICYQCHLADSKATERISRYGRQMSDFRPGLPITESVVAFRYEEPTAWDFGLSAQGDRMILSKCYEASDRKLECLTCHNPHVTVYLDSRAPDYFRKKCLSCHGGDDCAESMENRAQTTGTPDDCVACHMRKGEPDDQRFTEFTDHWIRRDIDIQRDERTNFVVEPVEPEDLARFSEGEQAFYWGRAYQLMALKLPEEKYDWMWSRAEEWFEKSIELGFENESSWFFLGKAQALRGKVLESAESFTKALEFDPTHHDARFALGEAYFRQRRVDDALALYETMVEHDPQDPMALAEYGRALHLKRRYEESEGAYERAVFYEPWNPTLRLNLGMSYAALGLFGLARQEGEQATRLNPDRPEIWSLYWNTMRETGESEKANEGRLQEQHWVEQRAAKKKADFNH